MLCFQFSLTILLVHREPFHSIVLQSYQDFKQAPRSEQNANSVRNIFRQQLSVFYAFNAGNATNLHSFRREWAFRFAFPNTESQWFCSCTIAVLLHLLWGTNTFLCIDYLLYQASYISAVALRPFREIICWHFFHSPNTSPRMAGSASYWTVNAFAEGCISLLPSLTFLWGMGCPLPAWCSWEASGLLPWTWIKHPHPRGGLSQADKAPQLPVLPIVRPWLFR